MRYFQTFEGGYAEGDTFMGVMVPDRQKVAKVYFDQWDERVLRSGLVHPIHEVRHTALFTLMRYYGRSANAGSIGTMCCTAALKALITGIW
jgi:hypothetical protein